MQVPMDPSERKKPLTLNLPPMILEELTEAAWQHRCSKSVLAERAIRAYLKLGDTCPEKVRPAEAPSAASPTPLTDLQRIAEAQKGRYGEAGQLDADWPDALERTVPPLEFSA